MRDLESRLPMRRAILSVSDKSGLVELGRVRGPVSAAVAPLDVGSIATTAASSTACDSDCQSASAGTEPQGGRRILHGPGHRGLHRRV